MGSITIDDPENWPYGPGNPDYEYDGHVARKLDEERDMNLAEYATELVKVQGAGVQAGVAIGKQEAEPFKRALQTVVWAYDRAGKPVLNTALMIAIENARATLK